jgi:hypothetical protein
LEILPVNAKSSSGSRYVVVFQPHSPLDGLLLEAFDK